MEPAQVSAVKDRARDDARAARDALSPGYRARAQQDACGFASPLLAALPSGSLVATYAAIGSELDPTALHAAMRAHGLVLVFPRVVRGCTALALHRCAPDQLAPGRFGIPEPPTDTLQVPPTALAAAVLPGLAFDRHGARLGWGRGHYDATLAAAPGVLRIGLAFEAQLVARVPMDAHDLPVHHLATEAALYACAARNLP